jgi:hypothetical protein
MDTIPIQPDPEDFVAVDAEYGPLARDASDKQATERYRLAQVNKLVRLNNAVIAEQPLSVPRACLLWS